MHSISTDMVGGREGRLSASWFLSPSMLEPSSDKPGRTCQTLISHSLAGRYGQIRVRSPGKCWQWMYFWHQISFFLSRRIFRILTQIRDTTCRDGGHLQNMQPKKNRRKTCEMVRKNQRAKEGWLGCIAEGKTS